MNRKMFFVVSFVMVSMFASLIAMDKQTKEMESIDEIPEYCVKLIKRLSECSLKKQGNSDSFKTNKIQRSDLCGFDDGEILANLSSTIEEDLRKSLQGIKLNFPPPLVFELKLEWDGEELSGDTLGALQAHYECGVRELQQGWEVSSIAKDYVTISKKLSWRKKKLISDLLNMWNIHEVEVRLCTQYRSLADDAEDDPCVLLKIRRDAVERVKSIFRFTTTKEYAGRLASYLEKLLPHSQNNLPELPFEMIKKIARHCWNCEDN